MSRTIRFHLDEHVDHAVADGLRRRGIAVTTTADADLLGAENIMMPMTLLRDHALRVLRYSTRRLNG
jgi:hypothetical protein